MSKGNIALHDEHGRHLRWLSPDQANSMLASQQAESCWDPISGSYRGIKLRRYETLEPEKPGPYGIPTPTSLTKHDMERNAAGLVDTAKKRDIYKRRDEGEVIPASIRYFGRDARTKKPHEIIVGNTVDESMTRVEEWAAASRTNKAVTVTPAGIVGLTVCPI